jgi:uncharacterized protein (TIGR02453 family)
MNTRELTNYLEGLAANNNRAHFAMNKPAYDILRAEFTALVAQVIEVTAKFDPAVRGQDPKKAQFRINRDVRFTKDKSPYKTHFSAVIAPNGKKDPVSHYYFHLDQLGTLLIGGGCYMPPPDVLKKIRTRLSDEPKSFDAVLRAKAMWAHFGSFDDQARLARPPKGFAADAKHIEIIKQKSFILHTFEPVKKIKGEALVAHIAAGFKASLPLVKWLREAGK